MGSSSFFKEWWMEAARDTGQPVERGRRPRHLPNVAPARGRLLRQQSPVQCRSRRGDAPVRGPAGSPATNLLDRSDRWPNARSRHCAGCAATRGLQATRGRGASRTPDRQAPAVPERTGARRAGLVFDAVPPRGGAAGPALQARQPHAGPGDGAGHAKPGAGMKVAKPGYLRLSPRLDRRSASVPVDDAVPKINEGQVVSSPALPIPCSGQSHEARRTGAPYRLGLQQFTVSPTQPVEHPKTRMDPGPRTRDLPSNGKFT
jgi:hypothetical protein